MKISYKWLQDYVDINLKPEQVAEYLTSTGLEVEGIIDYESVPGGLKGVVVGEVIECSKHPDADKLTICRVNTGTGEPLNIVCGAPNVEPGQKVVVATVGAVLFPFEQEGSFAINKAKIRGVSSEGMICAEDELGLGPSHDGIMVLDRSAVAGTIAAEYFGVYNDKVFEIGLTPNRTDAISHIGVARDLIACVNFRENESLKLRIPDAGIVSDRLPQSLPLHVSIENNDACKRYTATALSGVRVGESPDWLKNRLKAIGLKPHNNVVDVTNYVLHETGHPLHAFDYDHVDEGHIVVKNLSQDTGFITLDGEDRKLSENDLMICDINKPLCIAGVYGGINSGVNGSTKRIILESAWFNPTSVRRTAKYHGLNTDASFRFERGADPNITVYALHRAAQLICEITGASIDSSLVDVGEFAGGCPELSILVRKQRLNTIIGAEIDRTDLLKILALLGFTISEEKENEILLRVPSYRTDVTREIDVIEEVLRVFGMDNIPAPQKIPVSFPGRISDPEESLREKISAYLTANGFFEAWNNSLTSSDFTGMLEGFSDNLVPVRILNPLSKELDSMRQSLLPGLLTNAAHNINRKWESVNIFEFGTVYNHITPEDIKVPVTDRFSEKPVLALLSSGFDNEESWYQNSSEVSFFFIKQYVDEILRVSGFSNDAIVLNDYTGNIFDVGAVILHDKIQVAGFGILSKTLSRKFGIKQPVVYGEFDWQLIVEVFGKQSINVAPLPRFPAVRRDLSLVIDDSVRFQQIRNAVSEIRFRYLIRDIILFDVYEMGNLPPGKKSYAIGIVLQDPGKTLSDSEIDAVMKEVLTILNTKLGAVLR